ncbi:hypothetical protein ACHAWF_002106, partial [Thalassiosira exigua]
MLHVITCGDTACDYLEAKVSHKPRRGDTYPCPSCQET